jgi:diacylglycerol kinase family enzyme
LATLLCAATYRANSVRIRVDDREIFAGPLLLAAIANGNYFGGGMRIAPDAHCDDGLFDVVLIRELSKAELLKNVGSLYRGTHIEHPAVSVHRGQRVEVEPLDSRPAQLDIDGDPLGQVPAQIEILPRAISLLGGNAL